MSIPTPAPKSMATQVKSLYWGREWSGPRRTRPSLENATHSTKRMTSTMVTT